MNKFGLLTGKRGCGGVEMESSVLSTESVRCAKDFCFFTVAKGI